MNGETDIWKVKWRSGGMVGDLQKVRPTLGGENEYAAEVIGY